MLFRSVSTSLAFARHVLTPYYGDVELVLSADRAPVFFDPKHAWQATLLGRRALHALEGQAETLLTLHRATVAQLLDVYLDFAYAPTDGGAATP